jgi:hypothetical protein
MAFPALAVSSARRGHAARSRVRLRRTRRCARESTGCADRSVRHREICARHAPSSAPSGSLGHPERDSCRPCNHRPPLCRGSRRAAGGLARGLDVSMQVCRARSCSGVTRSFTKSKSCANARAAACRIADCCRRCSSYCGGAAASAGVGVARMTVSCTSALSTTRKSRSADRLHCARLILSKRRGSLFLKAHDYRISAAIPKESDACQYQTGKPAAAQVRMLHRPNTKKGACSGTR